MGPVRLLPLLLVAQLGCSDERDKPRADLGLTTTNDDLAPSPTDARCTVAGSPHLLSNLPGSHRLPRLAWNGMGYVFAWDTALPAVGAPQHRIDAQLGDADGNRQGPNLPLSLQPVADGNAPSLSPLVGGTLVAWTRKTGAVSDIVLDMLDHTGQRLDPSGQPCDPGVECGVFTVTTTDAARNPALTRPTLGRAAEPTETEIGLGWVAGTQPCPADGPCDGTADIFWKKVRSDGSSVLPDKRVTAISGRFASPRLAFDGVHYGLAWRDDSQADATGLGFATVDALGQISTAAARIGSATGTLRPGDAPDLVWSGTDYALVYASDGGTSSRIEFQRFASNGVGLIPLSPATVNGVACTPAVAWDGEHYAVAWQSSCDQPTSDVRFELLDPQGERVTGDGALCDVSLNPDCGILRMPGSAGGISGAPDLVWAGGRTFGLAWAQVDMPDGGGGDAQVYFTRIDCGQ